MRNPATDLRNHISTAAIGLTTGTNFFTGNRRPSGAGIPVNAAFIYGAPGSLPTRVFGESEEILTAVVILTLRWNKFSGGDTIMRDVRDNIQGASVVGYLDVLAQDTEPLTLGEDDDGNHLFMISAEMTYTQAKI